ncbi:MAG: CDP-glycerol glycerophosphotransferase family protein [Bdellovibrionales bacterium]
MSDVSSLPILQNDPPELEKRLAAAEDRLDRIHQFSESVTAALTHMLERLKDLEPITAWPGRFEKKLEDFRLVQTLAKASKIFPKTRTVVFVGRGYFGDNTKYAYLEFCAHARNRNVAVHYLTDDPRQRAMLTTSGLPCLPCEPDEWTQEDIRALFGARVVVLSDNFHPYCMRSPKAFGMLQGAKTVQMWHGIPIKNIGLRYMVRADNVLLDELVASSGPFDAFVAPAEAAAGEWAEMFTFDKFAALGYPRNDVFFRDLTPSDRLNTDPATMALFEDARRARRPTILYAPTFRDDAASGWFDKADIGALAVHAREKGYALAVNLHPYEQRLQDLLRKRYPDMHFVEAGMDIYPVTKLADVLITDYSSLAFDYLLTDRPLVFYRPDHEYYLSKSRGLIPGRERFTPGAVATGMTELLRALDSAVNFARAPATDSSRIERHGLRKQLFDHIDGNSSQRVCELIMDMIEADTH